MGNVKLKDRNGIEQTYNGVKRVKLKDSDNEGEYITFSADGGLVHIYSQMNDKVLAFIQNVDYTSQPYTVSHISEYYPTTSSPERKDTPNGIDLPNGEVILSDSALNNSYKATNIDAYNVLEGSYIILNNNEILKCGYLKTTGNVRMIKTETLENIRDIGGWNCDGNGTVKYGYIFRGSRLIDNNGLIINNNDIKLMKELLKIDSEIDYQVASEGGGQNVLSLINYSFFPISYLAASENYDVLFTTKKENLVKGLKKIMENVVAGYHTYIHCSHGADRTGATIWILEQLLGMSQSDIDKDYELTSMVGNTLYRLRNQTRYTSMINYISTNYTGDSMRNKVAKWCVENDISLPLINNYRRAIIDGNPQDIELYTNLIPTSIDATGSIYNGIGYKDGVYLSSGDGITESADINTFTSGFISVSNGDVLRCKFAGSYSQPVKTRIISYDTNKNKLSHKVMTTADAWDSVGNNIGTLTLTGSSFPATTAYIRLCLPVSGANTIATINEEI